MTENESAAVIPFPGVQTPEMQREALRTLLRDWWAPPEELIDTLPKAGMQLKYLSHVWVSRAFTEVDPCWWWEPMGVDEQGQPVIERDSNGHPVGLWIRLHLCGTVIPGYGSVEPGKRDAIKELIGDALRNAGMRRGCAGALWTKEKPSKAKAKAKEPLPAAVERNLEHLREQVDQPEDVAAAGKAVYDQLVQTFGKDAVNGALAMLKIAQFREITPAKAKALEASLKARERLVKEEEDRAKQLAKEQADGARQDT